MKRASLWLRYPTAVVLTFVLSGCVTARYVPAPEPAPVAPSDALPVPLQVANVEVDIQHAYTLKALVKDSERIVEKSLDRHVAHWSTTPGGEFAPTARVKLAHDTSHTDPRKGILGAVTLGLFPIPERVTFATTLSITSGGREVYHQEVHESIHSSMSIFFPTPLLFRSDKQTIWPDMVDAAMARQHTALAAWLGAEQEKFEREAAQTPAATQQKWLQQNPDSFYRGEILQFLAANPPDDNVLAWHSENLALFNDYKHLIPADHAVWFVGPEGRRVVDIRHALEQGEDVGILAARIRATRAPYRAFDSDETAVLREGGIPAPVIAAMIEVSGTGVPRNGGLSVPGSGAAPPPEVAALVIHGNSGQYMSPWTRDGHLAPWMSKALASSDMGAAAGQAIGSYAGAKAMESVPFIGRMLGEKLGEASGRSIALQAVGGEVYVRETSDLSFGSLDDMARYLQATYSGMAQYERVIEAADKIYPGLNDALVAAAAY